MNSLYPRANAADALLTQVGGAMVWAPRRLLATMSRGSHSSRHCFLLPPMGEVEGNIRQRIDWTRHGSFANMPVRQWLSQVAITRK